MKKLKTYIFKYQLRAYQLLYEVTDRDKSLQISGPEQKRVESRLTFIFACEIKDTHNILMPMPVIHELVLYGCQGWWGIVCEIWGVVVHLWNLTCAVILPISVSLNMHRRIPSSGNRLYQWELRELFVEEAIWFTTGWSKDSRVPGDLAWAVCHLLSPPLLHQCYVK